MHFGIRRIATTLALACLPTTGCSSLVVNDPPQQPIPASPPIPCTAWAESRSSWPPNWTAVGTPEVHESETAIRQSERLGEIYRAMVDVPSVATGGALLNKVGKRDWGTADRVAANAIDWMVEGSTYGMYNAQIATVAGTVLTVTAQSDIDADGNAACVALYQSTFDSGGVASATAPATSCAANPAAIKYGIPTNLKEGVF